MVGGGQADPEGTDGTGDKDKELLVCVVICRDKDKDKCMNTCREGPY